MQRRERPFLIIDVSLRKKFAGVMYSGAAGSLAAAVTNEVIALSIKTLALGALFPQVTAPIVAAIAFTHAAGAASDTWSTSVRPQDLRLRVARPPRIDF